MSIFGSLLQLNHSLTQTQMSPYDPYQDAWDKDSVTQGAHIDLEHDGAAWLNRKKDTTHPTISKLNTQGTPSNNIHDSEDNPTNLCEEPSQLKDFYDPEIFASRFGQDANTKADNSITRKITHTTPTIKEGQQSDFCICPCCQLPRAPGISPSSQISPPSPRLHHTPKDLCCECFCPDITMPKDVQDSPPSQKPHIRRRSSLSTEGLGEWHRKHDGDSNQCADRESNARSEMSVGAWL